MIAPRQTDLFSLPRPQLLDWGRGSSLLFSQPSMLNRAPSSLRLPPSSAQPPTHHHHHAGSSSMVRMPVSQPGGNVTPDVNAPLHATTNWDQPVAQGLHPPWHVQDSVSVIDGVLPMTRAPPVASGPTSTLPPRDVRRRPHQTHVVVENVDGTFLTLEQYQRAEQQRQLNQHALQAQAERALQSFLSFWSTPDDAKFYEPVVVTSLGHARTALRLISGFTAGFSMFLLLILSGYYDVPSGPILSLEGDAALAMILKERAPLSTLALVAPATTTVSSSGDPPTTTTAAPAAASGQGLSFSGITDSTFARSVLRYRLNETYVNGVRLTDVAARIGVDPVLNVSTYLRRYVPIYRELTLYYTTVSLVCVILSLAPLAHSLAHSNRAALRRQRTSRLVVLGDGTSVAAKGAGAASVARLRVQAQSPEPKPAVLGTTPAGSGADEGSDPRGVDLVVSAASSIASHLANFQFIIFAGCVVTSLLVASVETDRQKTYQMWLLSSYFPAIEDRLRVCVELRAWFFVAGWLLSSTAPPSFVRT